MTKEQLQYLENIGITGELTAKVEAVFNFYTKYIGCQLDDIFVSEFLNKDGSRVFENLWFFNKNYCFEAKQFMTTDDFDADLIKNTIDSFTIKKTDFDIISNVTNDNSRMFLEFSLKFPITGEMKASKENCKQLSMIFKKYIQPNLNSEL